MFAVACESGDLPRALAGVVVPNDPMSPAFPTPWAPDPMLGFGEDRDRALALLRMREALGLRAAGGPSAAARALELLDEVIELRRKLPLPSDRFDLAAAWLNRGEILLELGCPRDAREAIDKAINLLRDSAPGVPPHRLHRRRAIAHHNRGLTLLREGGREHARMAAACFEEAIARLDRALFPAGEPPRGGSGTPEPETPDDAIMAGCSWANLAEARLAAGSPACEAEAAARRALALVQDSEWTEPRAAEAALTARHVLCRILIRAGESDAGGAVDLPSEVEELVAAGIRSGRHWRSRFADLRREFFRIAVRIHEARGPQALATFILEETDPGNGGLPVDRTVHGAALDALWRCARRNQATDWKALRGAQEHLLAALEPLRRVEARLLDLRQNEGGASEHGLPPAPRG